MMCRPCTAAQQAAVVARRVTLNRYLWDWVAFGHGNCTGGECGCDHELPLPLSS
jgi:hypothetical protein